MLDDNSLLRLSSVVVDIKRAETHGLIGIDDIYLITFINYATDERYIRNRYL